MNISEVGEVGEVDEVGKGNEVDEDNLAVEVKGGREAADSILAFLNSQTLVAAE